MKQSASKSLSL